MGGRSVEIHLFVVTTSKALVTSSVALVTSSVALVTSSFLPLTVMYMFQTAFQTFKTQAKWVFGVTHVDGERHGLILQT